MKMMEELKVRGVKVADLAVAINESYGNTYTALKMDRDGKDIRHKAVIARLEKIRDFLGQEAQTEERLASQVDSKKDRNLDTRQRRRPVPDGHTGVFELVVGGVRVQVGSSILLSSFYATEQLPSGTYTFLRAVADEAGTITEVDIYGGPGHGEKWFPRFRTVRPEAIGFPARVDDAAEPAA
jgi:hypothetical protein